MSVTRADMLMLADALSTAYGCLDLVQGNIKPVDLIECIAEIKAAREKALDLAEGASIDDAWVYFCNEKANLPCGPLEAPTKTVAEQIATARLARHGWTLDCVEPCPDEWSNETDMLAIGPTPLRRDAFALLEDVPRYSEPNE